MGDVTDKYSLDWCANQGDRLFGEPRRRKGRRGKTHPYSREELEAQHIKSGGASKDAVKLGEILRKIKIPGSACPGCPDKEWCYEHRACIKPNSDAP